jgi:pseudo-rSAM protein
VHYCINFAVENAQHCDTARALIEEHHIEIYKITPFYSGKNLAFFESDIYLTAQDILSETPIQRMIFARQKLISHFFGALLIYPNGDVKANPNQAVIGNLAQENLLKIAKKELAVNTAWRQIRNKKPCNQCLYQYLCPSPSNYEWVIGQQNLCHVPVL